MGEFTHIRDEAFEVAGDLRLVSIYRCDLIAAALGLADDEVDLRCEFVLVPAGEFLMGSPPAEVEAWAEWRDDGLPHLGDHESPHHRVETDDYLIARIPMTQSALDAVGEALAVELWDVRNAQGDRMPVHALSWDSLQPLLAQTGLRLPSEAEWERACRADTPTTFSHGDLEFGLADYAWFGFGAGAGPFPVAQKLPNPWGLYDMAGNLWEWCADWWHDDYTGAPDDARPWVGEADDDPLQRVIRGGSYRSTNPTELACARRSCAGLYSASSDVGFRLAASL